MRSLPCGRWEVLHDEDDRGRLGFLLLEGVLARDLILAGATCTELLGEGDVVQPWVAEDDDGLVRYHVLWHVLAPVRLALLDEAFARSLGEWPQVMRALLERAVRRTARMSVHQALLHLSPVETRLLVLFWHLADRWGRVTPHGIAIRLRISHELLGQLVGSRRASVTTALRRISESGLLVRKTDGTWLLRGSPPDELSEIHWERAVSQVASRLVPVAVVFRCEFCGCRPGPETSSTSSTSSWTCGTASTSTPSPSAGSHGTAAASTEPTATRAAPTAAS